MMPKNHIYTFIDQLMCECHLTRSGILYMLIAPMQRDNKDIAFLAEESNFFENTPWALQCVRDSSSFIVIFTAQRVREQQDVQPRFSRPIWDTSPVRTF